MALSKPLDKETREKMVDFIEACIEALRGQEFDERTNDIAKKKGIILLQANIDISIMLSISAVMYGPSGMELVFRALNRKETSRTVAGWIVDIFEQGRAVDIGTRQN